MSVVHLNKYSTVILIKAHEQTDQLNRNGVSNYQYGHGGINTYLYDDTVKCG